jgi:hypothetical protein
LFLIEGGNLPPGRGGRQAGNAWCGVAVAIS